MLTWLGITVMVLALIAWVVYENRQLVGHVARLRRALAGGVDPDTDIGTRPGGTE